MSNPLVLNSNSFLILSSLSRPKTAALIIVDDLVWKSSKVTAETAPRTLDAILLHASPTKSLTENNL